MNINILKKVTIAVALILSSASLMAQGAKSPAASATGTINGANIIIKYSSPSVRGRKIFGELVPYDQVWRAGANEATVFTTDKKITVGKTPLEAGSYSIYAIPGDKTWKIIFNAQTGQWGTNKGGSTRDASKDVLSIAVKPRKIALQESLKYEITSKGFSLAWEESSVLVPIK